MTLESLEVTEALIRVFPEIVLAFIRYDCGLSNSHHKVNIDNKENKQLRLQVQQKVCFL